MEKGDSCAVEAAAAAGFPAAGGARVGADMVAPCWQSGSWSTREIQERLRVGILRSLLWLMRDALSARHRRCRKATPRVAYDSWRDSTTRGSDVGIIDGSWVAAVVRDVESGCAGVSEEALVLKKEMRTDH